MPSGRREGIRTSYGVAVGCPQAVGMFLSRINDGVSMLRLAVRGCGTAARWARQTASGGLTSVRSQNG